MPPSERDLDYDDAQQQSHGGAGERGRAWEEISNDTLGKLAAAVCDQGADDGLQHEKEELVCHHIASSERWPRKLFTRESLSANIGFHTPIGSWSVNLSP
jgi:hypothetical protein